MVSQLRPIDDCHHVAATAAISQLGLTRDWRTERARQGRRCLRGKARHGSESKGSVGELATQLSRRMHAQQQQQQQQQQQRQPVANQQATIRL